MSDHKFTDVQLIDRISEGDKIAFRLLFDRYYQILLATAINILKDVNTAKDATQEVFLQLWKNREKLEMPDSLIGYLKRAVINRSLNQIKARKSTVEDDKMIDMESPAPDAPAYMAAQDLKAAMKIALDSLPERCRLIFVMKRIEGLSLKEIAIQLDISPKTVENQITKALKVLKNVIRDYEEETAD